MENHKRNIGFLNCAKCPFHDQCDEEYWWEEDCWEHLVEYFNKKLKWRNGWDVVKNILCILNEFFYVTMPSREDQREFLEDLILDELNKSKVNLRDISSYYDLKERRKNEL